MEVKVADATSLVSRIFHPGTQTVSPATSTFIHFGNLSNGLAQHRLYFIETVAVMPHHVLDPEGKICVIARRARFIGSAEIHRQGNRAHSDGVHRICLHRLCETLKPKLRGAVSMTQGELFAVWRVASAR